MVTRVYLAGPIAGTTDAEMNDWRKDMRRRLVSRYCLIDPTVRDYRAGYADAAEVVEPDKADIDSVDIVIAYCPKPSVGTSMEVLYAWERGKSVLIYAPPDAQISPWLRYHSHGIVNYPLEVQARLLLWEVAGCSTSPTPAVTP